ncbi:hypothetical protein [Desmospora activa]|uniref:Uncharacterized protein n=1 Tax=Desmospora activa DSM 45169 TaxID=1121389 RepID=A0A2T4ZDI9_9BACL|nr:hypothetical protein [Desmospora activa]PTM59961.1 hypothetical protein C8J48_2600 [Desmospora activa DSM 45169]
MEICRFWGPGGDRFAQQLVARGIAVQMVETGYEAIFPDERTMETCLCEAQAVTDERVFFRSDD